MEQKQESPIVIDVRDVKKKFSIYYDRGTTLKERVLFKKRRKYEDHWVLKGISFQIRKGEAVGLIGENGCGKSTTLKMLTKILYPDSGSITMRGRVSSLIELGAGFHPDMSGRENIYTNASIFGLKRVEIDKRLQEIIDFSELGEFIDNPVRTYSSGMYMRLAFAVAINVDADILLIDEILAVGDAAFQAKCFNKLREIKRKGTTIVIVSHSLSQIEQICEKSIWIHNGIIREEGVPTKVHVAYMQYMSEREKQPDNRKTEESQNKTETISALSKNDQKNLDTPFSINEDASEKPSEEEKGSKIITIQRIYLISSDGKERNRFSSGQPAFLNIEYQADLERIDKEIMVGILIFRNDGVMVYGTNTRNEGIFGIKLESKGTIQLKFDKMNLGTGQYWIDIAFRKMDMFAYDYCQQGCVFDVMSSCNEVGIAKLDHQWLISQT